MTLHPPVLNPGFSQAAPPITGTDFHLGDASYGEQERHAALERLADYQRGLRLKPDPSQSGVCWGPWYQMILGS